MPNPEFEQVLGGLEKYSECALECDGLTRVLAYLLQQAHIEHVVKIGNVSDTQTGAKFAPHFWIDLPDGRRIDYRARMWLGDHEHIPHGVFEPDKYPVNYDGQPVIFENLEVVAPLLIATACSEIE
jgi:hypothetical protein